MPTSSQALIILSVDGRLPKKIPRQTFPVTSVPYPLRDYNMTETCMTVENCSDDEAEDVINLLRQGKRLQYPVESESLSKLLRVSSYKGSLTFDPVSKLLKWQINTELPPSSRNVYKNRLDDELKFPKIDRRENIKMFQQMNSEEATSTRIENAPGHFNNSVLPNTYSGQQNSQLGSEHMLTNYPTLQKMERFSTYTKPKGLMDTTISKSGEYFCLDREKWYGQMDGNQEEFEDKLKRTVSLPSLFKARIDRGVYEKLCSLGFRKSKEMKDEELRNSLPRRQNGTENHIGQKTWDNDNVTGDVEYSADKDFRLEDLSLRTDILQPIQENRMAANLAHLFPDNNSYQKYLKEREAFYNKFENYESYASTGVKISSSIPRTNVKDGPSEGYHKLPHIEQPIARQEEADDRSNGDNVLVRDKEPKKTLLEEVKEKSNYSKWKKRRLTTVRMRKEMPPPDPLCVCFNLPDNAVCHEDVKTLVEESCGGSISNIQFDPVNVVAMDNDARSRWIVRMRDMKSRDRFLQTGLVIDGVRRDVKLLDLVHQEEVDAYKFYELVQRGKVKLSENDANAKRKKSIKIT